MRERPDIAIVSLSTTLGWRHADEALAGQLRSAGATCRIVRVSFGLAGRLRRTMALTDAVEALAARRAAARVTARATIYSSITAALLQPTRAPHAVRFDTTAALSRPGAGGAWQRARERGVLARADLLLPWSEPAAIVAMTAAGATPRPHVVLPPPVERARAPAPDGPDAIAYAGNPQKRGLDLLCSAWAAARPGGARLLVGGIEAESAQRFLARSRVPVPAGVEWAGAVPRERWLALVAGARLFVNASRFEDWGIAQMEALAAGTPLATVATPGPNAALPLARRLSPALVAPALDAEGLARALSAGLAMDGAARARYAAEAEPLLEPYGEEALRVLVAERVMPALLRRSS